jgi:hypothetical protein
MSDKFHEEVPLEFIRDAFDWVRSLRDASANQGVRFFFKHWGRPYPQSGRAGARRSDLGRDADGRGGRSVTMRRPFRKTVDIIKGKGVGLPDNKEVQALLAQIERWPGWRVERPSRGWLVYPPDRAKAPITVHATYSDHRSIKNLTAALRRAGAPI